MRGIAIMAIILHNYCHFLNGIVRENEYLWKVNNVNRLWYYLQHPSDLLPIHLFFIVGFVAFTVIDAITPGTHRYEWLHVLGMLGMFSNLLEHPAQVIWPGPYWYFGLTLQLYIVYRLFFYRWRHWTLVVLLILLCWLWQGVCCPSASVYWWLVIRTYALLSVSIFCCGWLFCFCLHC